MFKTKTLKFQNYVFSGIVWESFMGYFWENFNQEGEIILKWYLFLGIHKCKEITTNEMENLRPNGQRANNAITLIWIVLIFEIVSFFSSYLQINLLDSFSNGDFVSEDEANANDLREQIIAIFYLLASIISAVTFILWFRRAYFNLHLKTNHLSHSEGWAAGSWFVPIISLYRPYQIMKEIYERTSQLLHSKEIKFNQSFSTSALGWWWSLWILSNVLGQITFRLSMRAESIDELTVLTFANMISNVVGIPLALITIKIIKDYADIEVLLFKIKPETDEATTELLES